MIKLCLSWDDNFKNYVSNLINTNIKFIYRQKRARRLKQLRTEAKSTAHEG